MNSSTQVPKHIAIIPDGNRRWARAQGRNSIEGHKEAVETVIPALLKKATELQIEYLTFWALSTENYVKRAKDEIDSLFSIAQILFKSKLNDLMKNGVRIRFIGDISKLPNSIQNILNDAVSKTRDNTAITFVIAVNYGGRDEIIRAIHKVNEMNYLAKSVTKENFGQFLDTTGIPDPDLIIRTGGEKRLSGFLPWQIEYSELYFSDLFFPDFKEDELEKAVIDFQNRQRRFGK